MDKVKAIFSGGSSNEEQQSASTAGDSVRHDYPINTSTVNHAGGVVGGTDDAAAASGPVGTTTLADRSVEQPSATTGTTSTTGVIGTGGATGASGLDAAVTPAFMDTDTQFGDAHPTFTGNRLDPRFHESTQTYHEEKLDDKTHHGGGWDNGAKSAVASSATGTTTMATTNVATTGISDDRSNYPTNTSTVGYAGGVVGGQSDDATLGSTKPFADRNFNLASSGAPATNSSSMGSTSGSNAPHGASSDAAAYQERNTGVEGISSDGLRREGDAAGPSSGVGRDAAAGSGAGSRAAQGVRHDYPLNTSTVNHAGGVVGGSIDDSLGQSAVPATTGSDVKSSYPINTSTVNHAGGVIGSSSDNTVVGGSNSRSDYPVGTAVGAAGVGAVGLGAGAAVTHHDENYTTSNPPAAGPGPTAGTATTTASTTGAATNNTRDFSFDDPTGINTTHGTDRHLTDSDYLVASNAPPSGAAAFRDDPISARTTLTSGPGDDTYAEDKGFMSTGAATSTPHTSTPYVQDHAHGHEHEHETKEKKSFLDKLLHRDHSK